MADDAVDVVEGDVVLVALADQLDDRVLVLVVDDGQPHVRLEAVRDGGAELHVERRTAPDVHHHRRGVRALSHRWRKTQTQKIKLSV